MDKIVHVSFISRWVILNNDNGKGGEEDNRVNEIENKRKERKPPYSTLAEILDHVG